MDKLIIREAIETDLAGVEEVNRLATEDLRRIYKPKASASPVLPVSTIRLVAELAEKIVGTVRYSISDPINLKIEAEQLHNCSAFCALGDGIGKEVSITKKITDKLREHQIVLVGAHVKLRPMAESDWDVIHQWDTDPEVLYFSEGDDVSSYTLEESQDIYRSVSQNAFSFIVEYAKRRIGYCWLQKMNMKDILQRFPDQDCRRIDLAIGEKMLWGRGLGTEIIGLLTKFGFHQEKADLIFGCGIADYNSRSRQAFEKNGYSIYQEVQQPEGNKAKMRYDLILGKDEHLQRTMPPQPEKFYMSPARECSLHIIGLMVHPSYRRLGVARAMVEALAKIARGCSAEKLSLYTICETGNVYIFKKLGFEVISEGPGEWAEGVDGQPLTEAYMERLV